MERHASAKQSAAARVQAGDDLADAFAAAFVFRSHAALAQEELLWHRGTTVGQHRLTATVGL
eukprot:3592883-Pyramimonas_sp.AAC.1